MYKTMYLDAAGDPGWPPPFGKSRVRWYVLAGFALAPDDDYQTKQKAEKLLQEYVPDSERSKWPDHNYEIHYHDIIYGKNIFSHLQDPTKKEISDKIFKIIEDSKPVLFATAINKTQLKHVYGSNAYDPRSLAMQSTIHRFAMHLEANQQLGTSIVDEEEYKKDKEIRKLIHQLRRHGASIRGRDYQPRNENRLERILNALNSSPSEMSTGIQLADVCSRSIWSHFENRKSNRYNQLAPFFDRGRSGVFEPSVIPSEDGNRCRKGGMASHSSELQQLSFTGCGCGWRVFIAFVLGGQPETRAGRAAATVQAVQGAFRRDAKSRPGHQTARPGRRTRYGQRQSASGIGLGGGECILYSKSMGLKVDQGGCAQDV